MALKKYMSEIDYVRAANTEITQTYSYCNARIIPLLQMIAETKQNWDRNFRTLETWMGNCTMGPDALTVKYFKKSKDELQQFI